MKSRPILSPKIAALLLLTAAVTPSDGVAQSDTPTDPPRPRRTPDPEKVHDPSTVLAENGVFRCFATGRGVTLLREQPDGRWLPEARLFPEDALPAWHRELVPDNRGHLWAPDVIQLDDRYLVYYSVSTFGSNTSTIGLASGPTLDTDDPRWAWEDHGPVIRSTSDDRYNAIDPALFLDPSNGRLFMTYGSFWDGIFITELDPSTGLRLNPDTPPRQLAFAPEIEAPFLTTTPAGKYALFVNWGRCCRGTRSTYEIRVGLGDSPTGPFLDRDGIDLRNNGGTPVLATDGRFIGPGHASLLTRDGTTFLVHHFYDGDNQGRSRLRMLPVQWDEQGWPTITTD